MTRVTLTPNQDRWLVYLEWSPKTGREESRNHPSLLVLERLGFVRFGGTRALPRIEAWHITPDGKDWLTARRVADREAKQ